MLKFSELQLIWKGLQAQQQAEDGMAAALRAIHPDNGGGLGCLIHPDLQAAHDHLVGKLFGSAEALDWWDWWRFEVVGGNPPESGWNIEIGGRRYLVMSLDDLFAVLVMAGYLPVDPEFTHTVNPVE